MTFSRELKSMIAKIGKKGEDSGKWLPFWLHSLDTAAVMDYLTGGRYASVAEICGLKYEEFCRLCRLAALLHDIGKVTTSFQGMIMKNGYRNDYINIPFGLGYEVHHSYMGEAILLRYGFRRDFASIIGAHHGMPYNRDPDMDERPQNYYYKDEVMWSSMWDEWIEKALKKAGYDSAEDIPKINQKVQILICGLIIEADWLSSNERNFPLIDGGIDCIDAENIDLEERTSNGINKIEFTEGWNSEINNINDNGFKEEFGFLPNAVQKDVIKAVHKTKNPGLIIIETPMGSGKTEAALAASEMLAYKNDKHGIFFGLPTQATANGIFERVMEWGENQSEEFYHSINLAHQNALFQPVFRNIQRNISEVEEDNSDSGLIVNQFFTGKKQACLADFVVGTVDRMLMAALKKKHTMLIHLGLSQKVVIIDECHAYDAYMNCYLERALHWLHQYNVPVILLSATLPPKRRKALVCAYMGKKEEEINIDKSISYPLITWTDGEEIHSEHIEYNETKKTVYIEKASDDEVMNIVKEAADRGGCVGIICNSVKRAQKFAKEISDENIDSVKNIVLYHAQYIMADRVKKEDELAELAGKNSAEENRRGTVVVGTQVLEQSLDIDFDLLITDLCPMDLLLQRMGRMYRHNRSFRPYDRARCVVLGANKDELERASSYIYGDWLLYNTINFLPDKISMPDDISRLVKDVYEEAEPENKIEENAYSEYRNKIGNKESRASAYLLGEYQNSSRKTISLHRWLNGDIKDNDINAVAAVRDGADSIEVIVIKMNEDKTFSLLPHLSNGKKFRADECPDDEDCRKIAMQRLRLPAIFAASWEIDNTIECIENMDRSLNLINWQKSHWLKGELILVLDEKQKVKLKEYVISYSKDAGIEYERVNEE